MKYRPPRFHVGRSSPGWDWSCGGCPDGGIGAPTRAAARRSYYAHLKHPQHAQHRDTARLDLLERALAQAVRTPNARNPFMVKLLDGPQCPGRSLRVAIDLAGEWDR